MPGISARAACFWEKLHFTICPICLCAIPLQALSQFPRLFHCYLSWVHQMPLDFLSLFHITWLFYAPVSSSLIYSAVAWPFPPTFLPASHQLCRHFGLSSTNNCSFRSLKMPLLGNIGQGEVIQNCGYSCNIGRRMENRVFGFCQIVLHVFR